MAMFSLPGLRGVWWLVFFALPSYAVIWWAFRSDRILARQIFDGFQN